MRDSSFSVGGTLTQGGAVRLTNAGAELHMMSLARLKAGKTLAQLETALTTADLQSQNDPTTPYLDAQVGWPSGFVTPGHSVELSAANLAPGRYAMICFIPSEGGGKPHFQQGMVGELDVVAGKAAAAAKADATYQVTPGKAVTGPTTLRAGTRSIDLVGVGDVGAHDPQLAVATGSGQSAADITATIGPLFNAYQTPTGAPKGTGRKLAEHVLFSGFDLGAAKTVRFTYDFVPGTYYLAVPSSKDTGASGSTPAEIVRITVS